MTLRTATYDTATHKIVPIDLTEEMLDAIQDCFFVIEVWIEAIAAAPEYQEPTKDE
jgi:hypothetical protein